jgi:DNA-binding transcriptional regulator YiaG
METINLDEKKKRLELANQRKKEIEKIIIDTGYSKSDLAVMAQVSSATFSNWLRGSIKHRRLDALLSKFAGEDINEKYAILYKNRENIKRG